MFFFLAPEVDLTKLVQLRIEEIVSNRQNKKGGGGKARSIPTDFAQACSQPGDGNRRWQPE